MTSTLQPEPSSPSAPAPHPTRARPGPRRPLLALVRPAQWPKNLVVLVAPFLQGTLWDWSTLAEVGHAVALFTLAASLVYVVNDLADRERDRAHPVKRHRPVASGAVSPLRAGLLGAGLTLLLVAAVLAHPTPAAVPVAAYVLINLLYSGRLKHVPLLDVFVLASGFVLRAVCGELASDSRVSPWLLTCILSVALLLAFGKRRHEMSQRLGADGTPAQHRPALRGYSLGLVDALITLTGAVTVLTYLSFLGDDLPSGPYGWMPPVLSAPLALFVLARYLQIVLVQEGGADPVRTLFTDRALLVVIGLWCLCFVVLTAAGVTGRP